MQYSWLEKMTTEGHVRPEVRDAIYADCSALFEKQAGIGSGIKSMYRKGIVNPLLRAKFKTQIKWTNRPRPMQAMASRFEDAAANKRKYQIALMSEAQNPMFTAANFKRPIVGPLLKAYKFVNVNPLPTFAGITATGVGVGAAASFLHTQKEIGNIVKNRASIAANPEFGMDKEVALARFDELVRVAPKAAENPAMANRLVADRLHSGFTTEDFHSLAMYQSQHKKNLSDINSIAKKVDRLATKQAEMSPEKIGEYYADVYAMCKVAAPGSTMEITKQLLKTIAIMSGVGLVAGAGAGLVNTFSDRMEKSKLDAALDHSFNEAMKRSDPNRESLHANKEQARRAFNTLVHFAPHVAVEPSAARAFMNNIVAMDLGPQTGTVKELADIEEKMQKTKGHSPYFSGLYSGASKGTTSPFLAGLQGGMAATGMSDIIGKTTGDVLRPFSDRAGEFVGGEIGFSKKSK